jgi:hypothetical protein
LRVAKIEPNHIIKACSASAANLPKTGYAWFHLDNPPAVPDIIDLEFVWYRRSGANERHLATQDVPELGKFIEACLSKEFANWRHARILRNLKDGSLAFSFRVALRFSCNELGYVVSMNLWIVIDVHRSEFEAFEAGAELTQPRLFEDYRALRRELNRHRN